MNRLRRMVLVNSANVDYREVELDGHIHFIGTQGTGKSTLLRALLFFYNADSRKLGISKEKKSFADYYFPYADSYIFYEVQAGARRFCVWLHKRQNRLCFRFVDGAYDRELAIDGQAARSEADFLAEVAQRGMKVERPIYNFTDYRDILYGENRAMRRYSLLQGISNYATIPRTISNIFLNANLDGGYIKKTIIDSLSDEAVEINLETNKHHLETARSHYADVSEYLLRENEAEQVVASFQSMLELEEKQRTTAWSIGAAFNQARAQQREMTGRCAEKAEQLRVQQQKVRDVEEDYQTEDRRIRDRLAEVKGNVAHTGKLKRKYDALGIDALLREAEEVPALKQQRNHCREEHRLLTGKAEEQEAHFQIALHKLQNDCQMRVHEIRSSLSDVKDLHRDQCDEARAQCDEQRAALKLDYEQNCDELNGELEPVTQALNEQRQRLHRSDYVPLFEAEQDALTTALHELNERRTRLEEKLNGNQNEIKFCERDAESRLHIEQNEGENRLRPLRDERERLTAQCVAYKEELARLSGSLLEFLDSEVPDWHETIGKTVRRDVLLQSGLDPRLVEGRSFFGVDLKLEHLESDALSKVAIEAELAASEKALAIISEKIGKQLDENRAAEDRLTKQQNRKLKELRGSGKELAENLFSTQRDLEKNAIAQQALNEKVLSERQRLRDEVSREIHTLELRSKEIRALIAERTSANDDAAKRLETDLNRRITQLKKDLASQESSCTEQIDAQALRETEQTQRLQAHRKEALQAAGIDASKVAALDEKINQLTTQLERIASNDLVRSDYAKDKRDWIDQLPSFQTQRKTLQGKMDHQTERFQRRIRNERAALQTLQDALNQYQSTLNAAVSEIREFEAFEQEQLFGDFQSFISHYDCSAESTCSVAIKTLQNQQLVIEKTFKKLRERIAAFAGAFSEGNCLGFEVHLVGETALRGFAEVLMDFVREQKIITLKTEVTKKYSMVLNTIVNETNLLLKREGDVQSIIRKINSDFRASNFVGVVHSIEMRMQASSNRIFQVLRELCQFQTENHLNFGEIDLFNTGDSGNDEKAVELLDQLRNQMSETKNTTLRLEDALDLEFRVCENENDTNWVNRLANVGSNGTDVLVKSMIYINLLNIFKTGARKSDQSAQLHCLVDEVGILHDSNVKSLIQFAAERGICMINGSPNSHNEQDYKHIYMFRKVNRKTAITKLISHES